MDLDQNLTSLIIEGDSKIIINLVKKYLMEEIQEKSLQVDAS